MKHYTTLLLAVFAGLGLFAQQRALVPSELRNISVIKERPLLDQQAFNSQQLNPYVKAGFTPVEEEVGTTWYDDQSNASIQNRLYVYPDGAIGATWILGMNHASGYPDRGTGYNYYDGSSWGPPPSERIEDVHTGWPSYAPLGEDGEIATAHTGATGDVGIHISRRDTKGTGSWNYSVLSGPPDHERMIWNRMVTGGVNHEVVHMIALTASTDYSGTPYMGLNGALLYSMSEDGGDTWTIENSILDGMTANEYYGFYSDTYTFAEPKDDIVAFVVGESWYDLFLMKSTDGGETFTKTVIWDHPYDYWIPFAQTDTFYCADGAHDLVIDDNGKVHVVFGINRSIADGTAASWFPFVDGIAYWNEDMPAFSDDLHALDPYGHPNSELIEDYNLIGWTQDVDGDGQITYYSTGIETMGLYYLGLSSMPQLVLDQWGGLFLFFTSLTETYDNGAQNYRHIWARYSPDGGTTWLDFIDLNTDLVHIFDECVYPSAAEYNDQNVYLLYQFDNEPGLHLWGDEDPATENHITFMQVNRWEITNIKEYNACFNDYDVYQNHPNPAIGSTTIPVTLRKSGTLDLTVTNMLGQVVFRDKKSNARPGLNKFSIDTDGFVPGIYFYTVSAGNSSATKKMLVE